MRGVAWSEAFALIFNSSLFLFRVWGVFSRSLHVKVLFVLLWTTTLSALAIPPSAAFIHLVPGCHLSQVKPVALVCFAIVTVFDTMVFFAISLQMLRINAAKPLSQTHNLAKFFHGKGMGNASKIVLQTGQFYYS